MISVPPNGARTVNEGEDVMLQCEVTGNPITTVIWSKKLIYTLMLLVIHHSCHKNSCLNIPAAKKEDAGVFQCSADNGVEDPDQATFYQTVQCKIFYMKKVELNFPFYRPSSHQS